MADPRIQAYARLLVDRCINVQPKWQVLVQSTPLARPLIEEIARSIAQRGGYALVRLNYSSVNGAWSETVPEDLLGEQAPIERYAMEHADAFMGIGAPENTRDGSELSPTRQNLMRQASLPARKRLLALEMPWVACQFPTQALAQEAGMTLRAYEDFLYGACLLDWDEEGKKLRRIADRFDRASQVRLAGTGTDLTLSLEGRHGEVDDGHFNMPGGEVFYSPVETATAGVVSFSEFPGVLGGNEVRGVRLEFRDGRVVDASASQNEEFLIKTLDADPGARVLGEFGIGANPGIQRHMKNTLFDEKIAGTIHLAIGNGFPHIGGNNVSSVHWDMVKDLRSGGQIACDGEVVQENGTWRI